MTTPRLSPISTTSQATQTERRDPTQLSHRYGTIGIQAVAAAAQFADRRKSQAHAPSAPPRIDLRFVESAN